jgi:hypothetical protein
MHAAVVAFESHAETPAGPGGFSLFEKMAGRSAASERRARLRAITRRVLTMREMKQFVEHRIGDVRLVRLLMKWLKAGVMVEGLPRVVAVIESYATRDRRAWRRGSLILSRGGEGGVVAYQRAVVAPRRDAGDEVGWKSCSLAALSLRENGSASHWQNVRLMPQKCGTGRVQILDMRSVSS